jgi:hypothetical protein
LEKTLTIDGKQVRFKSTAAVTFRYKNQFQKDYLIELFKAVSELENFIKIDTKDLTLEQLAEFDQERLLEIVWALAKTADPSIPEPLTWLDEFEEFPVRRIFIELYEMVQKTIHGKKK